MKWLVIIPIVLIAIIAGLSLYLQPNSFVGCQEVPIAGSSQCEKADAVVVVSGGDTNARTDEGIRLLKNGWADSIIFSGAAQDKSGPSNAAAMRLRALNSGVSQDAIYVEEDSATTEENALNTRTIFSDNDFKKIILVTSGYHQRRSGLEFDKSNPGIIVLNHPLMNDKDWSVFWWLTPRGWWLAGGEIAKIGAFYGQGAVK